MGLAAGYSRVPLLRLVLDLDRDHGSTHFNAERTQVSVDITGQGMVVVDIHSMFRSGSFY